MKRPWLVISFAAAICGAALVFGAPVAAGGNAVCNGPLTGPVNGNVSAQTNCAITNAQIKGNVQIQNTSGPISICSATIGGNLEVHNNAGPGAITISGVAVGGNLHVHNNSGPVTINGSCGSNSVGGNTEIHNNSGQVTISDTATSGNLQCQNDSPPASNGGGLTVEGKTSGNECSSSTTVICQAGAECTASIDDGNTGADVFLDGSGRSGKLTVTLSPPPADDGCGEGEGGPLPPSGDLVTVVPPGGYGQANPIEVDISYHQSESFFEMCKSNDGGKTFFLLPACDNVEGPPGNAPCLVEFSDPVVYITSTDPSLNGHT